MTAAGNFLAGDRVASDALPRGVAEGLDQRRLLCRVVDGGIEERELIARAPARLDVVETYAAHRWSTGGAPSMCPARTTRC